MPGPLPLPIEHGASAYGEETDIQRNIAGAAQYNPATKLGITAGDKPSKPALDTMPTPIPASKPGMGTKSGLEGEPMAAPRPRPTSPPSFASRGMGEHHAVLRELRNLSPEMRGYLGGGK